MRLLMLLISAISVAVSAMAQTPPQGRLFPIGSGGSGAHGSQWVVEHYLHNHSDRELQVTNTLQCNWSGAGACLTTIPPHSTLHVSSVDAPFEYWFVPEPDAEAFTITSLVRNVSGDVDPFGTMLPSPELEDFRRGFFRLAPLPAQGEFRMSLRAYTHPFDLPSTLIVDVEVWRLDESASALVDAQLLKRISATFIPRSTQQPGTHLELHALLDDLDVEPGTRVSARLIPRDPALRIWAFASLTHNDSQHVTVFVP